MPLTSTKKVSDCTMTSWRMTPVVPETLTSPREVEILLTSPGSGSLDQDLTVILLWLCPLNNACVVHVIQVKVLSLSTNMKCASARSPDNSIRPVTHRHSIGTQSPSHHHSLSSRGVQFQQTVLFSKPGVIVTSTMTYCSPAAKIITTVLAKFNMWCQICKSRLSPYRLAVQKLISDGCTELLDS